MKTILYFFATIMLLSCGYSNSPEGHNLPVNTEASGGSTIQKQDSASPSESDRQKVGLPVELLSFVNKPYIVHNFEKGDLNKDGLIDYILVLRKQPHAAADDEYAEKLLVHLILRQKDNSLVIHSSNPDLLEFTEGAYENDLISLDSLGGGFDVSYTFRGSGIKSTSNYYELNFKYSKKSNQWELAELIEESVYNSPTAAIGVSIEEARIENPNYTEEQLDSLAAVYEEIYTEAVQRTVKNHKQLGVIPFSKVKKSELLELE